MNKDKGEMEELETQNYAIIPWFQEEGNSTTGRCKMKMLYQVTNKGEQKLMLIVFQLVSDIFSS